MLIDNSFAYFLNTQAYAFACIDQLYFSYRYITREKKMPDWGPVFVAVALFVLLTPGVLIQIPGKNRVV